MTATSARTRANRFAASSAQKAAVIFGITFLLVGVLGFVPGVTSNLDSLEFASHHSGALLLGLFQVSVLHNAVHVFLAWLAFCPPEVHVPRRCI